MYSSKISFRATMLKIRNSLPVEMLGKLGDEIQAKILSASEFTTAKTIGAYYPIGSEVSTSKILNASLRMNKQLALPRVIDDKRIIFAEVKQLESDLEIGRYRIMAPKEHCVPLTKLDLLIVPGIAWDLVGHRIGYGHGYYDRYLSQAQTVSIGLAYEFQLFTTMPNGAHDIPVGMIVTEKRIIRGNS